MNFANTKSRYLVNGEAAANVLTSLQIDAGLKARFGDPSKFPAVGHAITTLHVTVRNNVSRVVALAQDETRTEVAKHAAARELAHRTVKAIEEGASALKVRAEILHREGVANADEAFAPRPGYSQLESETRQWMREQTKSAEGMTKVSSLAKEDRNLAAVIYHSPYYLTGIAKELHRKMQLDAVERFAPDAYAKLNESVELSEIAGRYANSVRDVNQSFFMPALADKAASRVEV